MTIKDMHWVDWAILVSSCLAVGVVLVLASSGHKGFCVTVEGMSGTDIEFKDGYVVIEDKVEPEDVGVHCFKTPIGSYNYTKYLIARYHANKTPEKPEFYLEP